MPPLSVDLAIPASATCRGCGYALQGLESRRCPECGRAFDPANRKSMHLGRSPGRLARWLAKPVGRTPLVLAFLATAAVAYATRVPLGPMSEWKASGIDLPVYLSVARWRAGANFATPIHVAYAAGLAAWIGVIVLVAVRMAARAVVHWRFGDASASSQFPLRRAGLGAVLMMMTAVCAAYGWPFRLGIHVAELGVKHQGRTLGATVWVANETNTAFNLSGSTDAEKWVRILRAGLIQPPSANQREAVARVAPYIDGVDSAVYLNLIRDALAREPDADVVAGHIQSLGFNGTLEEVPLIAGFFEHPSPRVRAAIAYALGLLREPAREVDGRMPDHHRNAIVPVFGATVSPGSVWPRSPRSRLERVTATAPYILRLREMMVGGQSIEERDAAAWALLDVPPDVDYRLSQWGVWRFSADPGTRGDSIGIFDADSPAMNKEFKWRPRNDHFDVHKSGRQFSVTHIHSPIAISVRMAMLNTEAMLARSAPLADETSIPFIFSIGVNPHAVPGSIDPERWTRTLEGDTFSPRSPLPWRASKQTLRSDRDGPVGRNESFHPVTGYRWHQLAVVPPSASPFKDRSSVARSTLPDLSKLKSVPGSLISNRGESERFIYVEGRSSDPFPFSFRLDGDTLFAQEKLAPNFGEPNQSGEFGGIDDMRQTARADRRRQRRGMFVDVAADGAINAEVVPVPNAGDPPKEPTHQLGTGESVAGPAVEALLRDWVIDAGLTPAEADGMIACWREPFFAKPGKRFLMLLSAVDYDSLCPIEVKPKPTELVRVGVVWTEFDPVEK